MTPHASVFVSIVHLVYRKLNKGIAPSSKLTMIGPFKHEQFVVVQRALDAREIQRIAVRAAASHFSKLNDSNGSFGLLYSLSDAGRLY